MKYIKRYNEDIDWDFDIQEEDNSINIDNLTNYYIEYNTFEECENITIKLLDLGFELYNSSCNQYNMWRGFIFKTDLNKWVKTMGFLYDYKEQIKYKDIKNL